MLAVKSNKFSFALDCAAIKCLFAINYEKSELPAIGDMDVNSPFAFTWLSSGLLN
jgi:hypothetical protein